MTARRRKKQPLTPEQRADILGTLWREECLFFGPEEAARERLRHEAWRRRELGEVWVCDEIVAHAKAVLAEESRKRQIVEALEAPVDRTRPPN